jgi:transposase
MDSKKNSTVDPRQKRTDVKARRNVWKTLIKVLVAHLSNMVFVDETALHPNMHRRYGRSKRGHRAVFTAKRPGRRNTLIGALGYDGPVAHRLLTAGMTSDDFEAFLREDLLPALKPGSLIVVDNLNIHTEPWVKQLVQRHSCMLLYLPQYSPELAPIELAFNKLKALVRANHPKGVRQIREALARTWTKITPEDARAFYRECGLVPAP